MDVADVLEAAADIIERDGWCQGAFEANGSVCLLGALRKATIGTTHIYDVGVSAEGLADYGHARDAVSNLVGFQDLASGYNDAPGRTEFEVIDTLRHCAEALRNGEIDVTA